MAIAEAPASLSEAPQPATAPHPRKRLPWGVVMKWVRRVHMYSGLLLFPWVLLYGVTALLFNRPDVFSEQTWTEIGAEDLTGTPLATPLAPSALAEDVVSALNASRSGAASPYTLVAPESARFANDIFLIAKGEGQEHAVRMNLETGTGRVGTRTQEVSADAAPFAVKSGLKLERPVLDDVQAAVKTALERHGLKGDDVSVRFAADLTFRMQAEGREWKVTYNPQRGSVSAKPAAVASEFDLRRFLLRLHTAHGYPAAKDARWFWAIIVDVMFAAMVFWGGSGLFMWWQIRSTRWWGAWALLVSALLTFWLTRGMYQQLVG